MAIHPRYVERQRRLEVCRRCEEFSISKFSRIEDLACCSQDVDPWDGATPIRSWETGHVPKSCARLAEYDPAEALRQL